MVSPLEFKIAFAGRACTGKTDRARALEKIYPACLRSSFATPLKAKVAAKHNISIAELEARKDEFRDDLQKEGDIGRRKKEFLNGMQDQLDLGQELGFKVIVVDDVRRHDEADLLRENGFTIIKLIAPREVLEERYRVKFGKEMTEEQWNHASEKEAEEIHADEVWNAEEDSMQQVRSWLMRTSLGNIGTIIGGGIGRKSDV